MKVVSLIFIKRGEQEMKKVILLSLVFFTLTILFGLSNGKGKLRETRFKDTDLSLKNIIITVVYDNNPYDKRLKTAWGFSCLVKIDGKNILFDTGGDSHTLLSNIKKLDIDPREINAVVLSHIHGDHVGGLFGFLQQNSNVTVYLPRSFPKNFKEQVESFGAKIVEISKGEKIFENVYTTGELGTWIKEQSLIIKRKNGFILITGCAHPGVVNILEKSKQLVGGVPFLVMGGFHLVGTSDKKIRQIIEDFKRLDVQKVGPCHCSGDRARNLFRELYGANFIEVGVGKIITIRKCKESSDTKS